MSPTTCLFLIALVASFAFVLRKKSRDPYGLWHTALNFPAKSEWLNMGYWQAGQTDFPTACKELALRVARAGRCKAGGHVLDVGHATGDSLLLHLESDELLRPATLTGITSLSVQHERAVERVADVNANDVTVRLHCGDAIQRDTEPHPFKNPPHRYTSILAIDCAYHFDTRKLFLQQAYEQLEVGGYIALADLVIARKPSFLIRSFLSAMVGIRSPNIMTQAEYVATLQAIGYEEVALEDISEHVFPSFVRFLRTQGLAFGAFSYVPATWYSFGGRFVIVSGRKPIATASYTH